MTDKKKKIIFAAIIIGLVFIIFFAWYGSNVANKYYVKFNGGYYDITGGIIDEENISEIIGEIKRITPRTFWNKDGDSNFSVEGAEIVTNSKGEYFAEMFFESADTGTIKSKFFRMVPQK